MFKSAKYIKSIVNGKDTPNNLNLPEFVFVGRSNVGKSSLINALVGQKKLAYTSSDPGKTLCLNFYLVEDKYYFVDVPGYGYARKSIDKRIDFGAAIESYLINNPNLKKVFLLIDTKVGMTEDDILMYNYLVSLNLDFMIILTKADKVPKTHLIRYTKKVKENVEVEMIVSSSIKKLGIEKIEEIIR